VSLPKVTVLVHGSPNSIEAVRARGLTQRAPSGSVEFLFREGSRSETARRWKQALQAGHPDLLYVLNTALPGAPMAVLRRRFSGLPFLLDTGDVIFEMARRSGIGAGWRLPLLWMIEQSAWRTAARIVVRGTRHAEYLQQKGLPAALIRDGYAEQQSVPPGAVEALRTRLGLGGRFVVGLMGSQVWSPRLQICYGWDLIRAMTALRDLPVTAVLIGDGNGQPWLHEEARRRGVQDRIVFTGRIPYAEVPTYMRLLDVALSTQTNNLPGQVRTTGKIPEYMAAGCFILASRVGDAAVLLPESMLVPYNGEVDDGYPARLAEHIRHLVSNPASLDIRQTLPGIAQRNCSYEILSRQWLGLVNNVLTEQGSRTLPSDG
jgi:glycosyltransferase involved in cell wall biosynthesis